MNKIMSSFFIVFAMTLVLTGCKGKDSVANDPKAVLVSFFERLSKKDIDGASKLATKDSKATMDLMKKGMEMAEKMKDNKTTEEKDPTDEFKNVEIGEAKINGDDATVSFKNSTKGVSFDFPLKKEEGSWKVDFSMATLMKMGMEQGGKAGGMENMTDSAFNHMNIDSLKQGMKIIQDSLMKDPEKMKEVMEELNKLKTH